jgi:single-strand DNA-binding protein
MRYSQNGTPITNFSIAVNRRRRGMDGNFVDETDWYRVSLFRNAAETANEYLKKGTKVLVEGQLQIRTFTGQDGMERTSVEVNADNFMILTPRDDPGEGAGGLDRQQFGGGRQSGGYAEPQAGRTPGQQGGRRQEPADDDFDDLDDVPF